MEKVSVTIEVPKIVLKWIDKIALYEGKSLEATMVEMMLKDLAIWLLDEDNQVAPELVMQELVDDGVPEALGLYDCCPWRGEELRAYTSKRAERLVASQSKTALTEVSKT